MSTTERDGTSGGQRRRPRVGTLIKNAIALMISSGGTALLGVVFWGLAARMASSEVVGRATSEIAAMVLLANLSQLSFTTVFDRFLPVTGDRTRRFVRNAYLLCMSVGLVIATIYVLAGFGTSSIPSGWGWKVLFILAVVLWTIFILQDSVLTGLRATTWVPVENIAFAAAKIALLPAFLALSPHQGIFLAWTLPLVISAATVNWYLFRRRIPRHEAERPDSDGHPSLRELVTLSSGQYATWLISTISSSVVVLIILARLGASSAAYYSIPALISSGLALLLWNMMTSFLVEGSHDPSSVRRNALTTLRLAVTILTPAVVLGVVFAPLLLRIFGPSYAAHGTTLLRLLLLSLPGTAVVAFYSSFAWLDRRVWWLAVRELMSSALYFATLFFLIGRVGILAAGYASLASSGLLALFFLPVLVRRFRSMREHEQAEQAGGLDEVI